MDLRRLAQTFKLSGDVARDVPTFLVAHDRPTTAEHCCDVAAEARRVAVLAGISPYSAEIAGWLHDVSAIFPPRERLSVALAWGIDVLPEEASYPAILHQKLSAVMARDLFGIRDEALLSAIGCHTTLKLDAGALDKVVFVADKLAWDQPGVAPFHAAMCAALAVSLDQAALVYLQTLWDLRDTLPVLHPWARDAYRQLSAALNC